MKTLVLATRNAGKVRELQSMLGPLGYSVITAAEAGYHEEPEETGKTFRENAHLKARAVAAHVPHAVLADDSGLEVEALGGAPGLYSARYAGPKATDAENREKLLRELGSNANRKARFVCALCWLEPNMSAQFFESECRGRVTSEPKGTLGFGYDPILIPEGHTRTFAEMPEDEKNPMSHRGKAVKALLEWLKSR